MIDLLYRILNYNQIPAHLYPLLFFLMQLLSAHSISHGLAHLSNPIPPVCEPPQKFTTHFLFYLIMYKTSVVEKQ